MRRRDLMRAAVAASAGFALPRSAWADPAGISVAEALDAARQRPNTLAGRAARKNILFGTSLNDWDMADAAYLEVIARESSILVPENALKANQYRASPDHFDFSAADKVIGFATENKLAARGHTLCWFNSVPPWVPKTITSPEAARQELLAEVAEPCRHFAGRMQSWDVVNEVVRPDDGLPLGLHKSYWLEKIGPDYIDLAFFAAHEADPAALLTLNDMDLEYDHPYFETKRAAVLALLKRLIANKVPIGGVGIQAHLQYVGIGKFPFTPSVFHRFLSDIADLGLKIIISELDVPDRNLPADVPERDSIVAKAIGDLLFVAASHPAVIAIVTWAITDRYSWMQHDPTFQRSDGLPSRGTLLDQQMIPKTAYWAAIQALDQARR